MTPNEMPSPQRLRALIDALPQGLLEREDAARLMLLAALAGEHVLLLGPPGTAKSALARRLHRAFEGGRYFERLLTRFSTPEELFGPLSLRALEDDRYERLFDGYLPTAGVAFLDEVFKANSAILNALLTLLEERQFDNGTERLGTPLVCLVAASNELPSDEALQAFHDRFLVRLAVAPVSDASFGALLALPPEREPALPTALRAAEREAIAAAADAVNMSEPFAAGCQALRAWLAQRQAPLSDRRWRRFVALARVAAASEGRASLDELDLALAPYVAAPRPEDLPPLEAWFVDDVVAAPPEAAPWLQRAIEGFEKQLGIEQQAPPEEGDDQAGKLAVARAIGLRDSRADESGVSSGVSSSAAMPRIVAPALEAQQQRQWGALHVHTRIEQVQEIEAQVADALVAVNQSAAALRQRLEGRLWLPPSLARRVMARHDAARAMLESFAARLRTVRAGFAELPVTP